MRRSIVLLVVPCLLGGLGCSSEEGPGSSGAAGDGGDGGGGGTGGVCIPIDDGSAPMFGWGEATPGFDDHTAFHDGFKMDATHLYWVGGETIQRVERKRGAVPEEVGTRAYYDIEVDETSVYYSDYGGIRRVPLTGGTSEQLEPTYCTAIRLQGDLVYCFEDGFLTNYHYSLKTVSKSTGAVNVLFRAPDESAVRVWTVPPRRGRVLRGDGSRSDADDDRPGAAARRRAPDRARDVRPVGPGAARRAGQDHQRRGPDLPRREQPHQHRQKGGARRSGSPTSTSPTSDRMARTSFASAPRRSARTRERCRPPSPGSRRPAAPRRCCSKTPRRAASGRSSSSAATSGGRPIRG